MRQAERTGLSHIDARGRARMVDVTGKAWSKRRAIARCRVVLSDAACSAPLSNGDASSDRHARSWNELLDAARVAGIQAAKQTSNLVPLCHPLASCDVGVALSVVGDAIEVEGRAEVIAPTGVEMEALTACAVAGLTLLAAILPVHPEASIQDLTLWEKSGGRSGTWIRT